MEAVVHMGLYLGGALVWLVLGTGVAFFGRARGLENLWSILGVVAWPVALARILSEPPDPVPPERMAGPMSDSRALVVARIPCPSCDQPIRADSQSCPFCLHRLESAPVGSIDWPPWPDPNSRTLAQNIVVPLAFEYVSGEERTRRRILATLLFEWAEALYLRGHESARSGTRSYSLARMKNVVDERTGERLDGIEAIRDALLRRGLRRAADTARSPDAEPARPTSAGTDGAGSRHAEPMQAAAPPARPHSRPDADAHAEPPPHGTTVERAAAVASAAVLDRVESGDHGWTAERAPTTDPAGPPTNGTAAVTDEYAADRVAEAMYAPAEVAPPDTGIDDLAESSDVEIPSPPGLAPLPSHMSLTPANHWLPAERRRRMAVAPRPAQAFAFLRGAAVAGGIAIGAVVFILENRGGSDPQAPAAQAPVAASSTGAAERSDGDAEVRAEIQGARRELMELVAMLRAAAASVKPAPAPATTTPPAARPTARGVVPAVAPSMATPPVRLVRPRPAAPPVDWSTPLTPDEVRELQTMLIRLGYRPGRIDGLTGPRTVTALAAWQRDRQLLPSRHSPRVLLGMMRDEIARRSVLRVDGRTAIAAERHTYE